MFPFNFSNCGMLMVAVKQSFVLVRWIQTLNRTKPTPLELHGLSIPWTSEEILEFHVHFTNEY